MYMYIYVHVQRSLLGSEGLLPSTLRLLPSTLGIVLLVIRSSAFYLRPSTFYLLPQLFYLLPQAPWSASSWSVHGECPESQDCCPFFRSELVIPRGVCGGVLNDCTHIPLPLPLPLPILLLLLPLLCSVLLCCALLCFQFALTYFTHVRSCRQYHYYYYYPWHGRSNMYTFCYPD